MTSARTVIVSYPCNGQIEFFTLTQQDGESNQAFADRVAAKLAERLDAC